MNDQSPRDKKRTRSEADRAAALPANARDAIGKRLRESLDRIVAEPVPDRFLQLLDQLERSDVEATPKRHGGDRRPLEPTES